MRTVHEMPLHLLRILELLHEARMFAYSRNVEGLHLGADGEDEVVIGDRRRGHRALDLRRICKACERKSPLTEHVEHTCEGDRFLDRLQDRRSATVVNG